MDNIEMGNQQAKSTDVAWLAGIIDGEGSILLGSKGKANKHPGYNGIQIGATIHIVNTDGNIIDKCCEVIASLGVSYHLAHKGFTANHSPVYRIDIGKMIHIKTLLEAIMPYLVGKIGQAKLVHRFVSSRLEKHAAGLPRKFGEDDLATIDEYYNTYHGKRHPHLTLPRTQSLND